MIYEYRILGQSVFSLAGGLQNIHTSGKEGIMGAKIGLLASVVRSCEVWCGVRCGLVCCGGLCGMACG